MKESPFVEIFKSAASDIAGDKLIVRRGANLLYQIQLNRELKLSLSEEELRAPKRGNSAFQTDICVFDRMGEVELPRVVIEFKTVITTHDILTYSTKAGSHKRIYPYLRYGLLLSEMGFIPGRVFTHNQHIDFVIAALKYKSQHLRNFAKKLLEEEIEISRTLEAIHFDDKKYDFFRADIKFQPWGQPSG